jgi:hypothetical protein
MDARAGLKRPHTAALEWIARLVSLVLAGLVTLSIIGAIAAIPSRSIGTRIGYEPARQVPQPQPVEPAPRPEPSPARQDAGRSAPAPGTTGAAAAPAAEATDEAAEWLEAITYALMALVGIAALAVLLLWRGLAERRRLADAIELLAARTRPG